MTQQVDEIPSLEDFTESSLLDQITDKGDEGETSEEKEAREATEAAEAAEKAEQEEAAAKAEEEKLAKEQAGELTEEELEAQKEAEAKKKEEEGSFWDDVEAITGNTYEVEYGDVEPDSPEGAAIREEIVTKKAVEENLAYLEEKFPEGFKALMHVSNGGKLTDLYTATQGVDYNTIKVEDTDTDAQKAFMKDFYLQKGFSEAKAVRNVEDDEDSEEGLEENFKDALKEKQEEQENKTQAVLKQQEEAKAKQDAQDKQFGETISSIINKGQVGNFKVDKKDAENFYNHVLSNVQRNGNGYAVTVPLTNDNFQEQLQQMFFGFKKGDLSKFVKTAASTQNAKRLKRSMRKDKGVEEGASEAERRKYGEKLPTLGAFETE